MSCRFVATALAALLIACDPGGGTSSLLPDTDAASRDTAADGSAELPLADVAGDEGPSDAVLTPEVTRDAKADAAPDAEPDAKADAVPDVVPDVAPDATPDAVADVADDAKPMPTGTLGGGVVLSEVDSPFVNVGAAAARFIAKDPPPQAGTTYGPCVVAPSGPSTTPPTAYGFDAGAIQATGTQPAVALTPKSEGALGTGYGSNIPESQEDLLPAGGGLITVKGAGGADIPAFTAVVQAPEAVTLKSPALTFNLSASAKQDLALSWNAGAGQPMVVNITPVGSDYKAVDGLEILCTASPGATGVTVPKEALAAMLGNASSRPAIIGVTRANQTTATAGSLTLSVGITRSTGGPIRIDP